MMEQEEWLSKIEAVDISVFKIRSQTTAKDKRSLLKVQNFMRGQLGTYSYIEIGSHLGGSLVPHLVDPACTEIASVDPRPAAQRDERGLMKYDGNSTQRMIDGLAELIPTDGLSKLKTYDCDAGGLKDFDISPGFTLGMIDGEHTITAAFRDFLNVRKYMAKDSVILFHDSHVVFDALLNIETLLRDEETEFESFFVPGIVYALALGKMAKPAKSVLGEFAHDSERFVRRARRRLQ